MDVDRGSRRYFTQLRHSEELDPHFGTLLSAGFWLLRRVGADPALGSETVRNEWLTGLWTIWLQSSAWFTTSRVLVYSLMSATDDFSWGETAWSPLGTLPSLANRQLCAYIVGMPSKRGCCRYRSVGWSLNFTLPTRRSIRIDRRNFAA